MRNKIYFSIKNTSKYNALYFSELYNVFKVKVFLRFCQPWYNCVIVQGDKTTNTVILANMLNLFTWTVKRQLRQKIQRVRTPVFDCSTMIVVTSASYCIWTSVLEPPAMILYNFMTVGKKKLCDDLLRRIILTDNVKFSDFITCLFLWPVRDADKFTLYGHTFLLQVVIMRLVLCEYHKKDHRYSICLYVIRSCYSKVLEIEKRNEKLCWLISITNTFI